VYVCVSKEEAVDIVGPRGTRGNVTV